MYLFCVLRIVSTFWFWLHLRWRWCGACVVRAVRRRGTWRERKLRLLRWSQGDRARLAWGRLGRASNGRWGYKNVRDLGWW